MKVQQFRTYLKGKKKFFNIFYLGSNLSSIMKNVVVNSAIMYDLKEKNLILDLFKAITAVEYPEENVKVKQE